MAKPPHEPADGYDGQDTTARVVLRELTEASDRRKDHRTFDRILEANHGDGAGPAFQGTPPETPAASSRATPTLPRVTLPLALRRRAPAHQATKGAVGFGSLAALAVAVMLLAGSLALLGHVLSGHGEVRSEAAVLAPRAPVSPVHRRPTSMATEPPARPTATVPSTTPPAPLRPRPSFAAAPSTPAPRPAVTTTPTNFVEEY